ncbi:hypothetical protein SAMN05661096_02565 [Marivirga sericea]|uniref:Lipocalin-like domain-containing protein n=1 Tax=Marivirga sericea TaxID=1028 RepID=A0A1X7KD08_9BACT|nr:hypothetical protein [Marivirga sericea]SMG38736.1 hypothetical protein SAMN05661096_02565 [Marivirga sericea]
MKYVLTIILMFALYQSEPEIIGRWQIQSFEAIDKIKQSPAYTYGDADAREQLDKLFNLMLENGEYYFKNDTLYYSDIEHGKIIKRRAIWTKKDDILTINEIDRVFERQAQINFLSKDSFAISLIIHGKAGDSNLIFTKIK